MRHAAVLATLSTLCRGTPAEGGPACTKEFEVSLLRVLGLAAPAEVPVATGGLGARSRRMQALVARFDAVMVSIDAEPALARATAASLRRSAVAAGNLATSPKGVDQAHAALHRVEARLAKARAAAPTAAAADATPRDVTPVQSPPATVAVVQPQPQPVTDGTEVPAFKGYPATLQNAEKLIGQVKRYGFSEGIHATSMDAADRGDVQEIWCSGLSNWALAEAGFDLDAPLPGKTFFVKQDRKNKKTGKTETVTVEKPLTLRALVEGYATTFADTAEEAGSTYAQAGLFGKTPAEDDPRVKGAPGAFVLAGIGREVLDLEDVKPGDFAQTREVGGPTGHAFQIHACLCEGEVLVGPAHAPVLVKDLGGETVVTAEGTWYAKAQFRLDGNSSPRFVGLHRVVKSDWLESNVASSMEDKSDTDGGVQVRHGRRFEDPTKPGAKRTYVGRLNGSSWAGLSRHAPLLQRPAPAALTGT